MSSSNNGSAAQGSRKPNRSGRGRSNGRGGRRGGRGNRNNGSHKKGSRGRERNSNSNSGAAPIDEMRDEQVLIAFMPYLKSNNQDALQIHTVYQDTNDQKTFLQSARAFLARKKTNASAPASQHSRNSVSPVPQSKHSRRNRDDDDQNNGKTDDGPSLHQTDKATGPTSSHPGNDVRPDLATSSSTTSPASQPSPMPDAKTSQFPGLSPNPFGSGHIPPGMSQRTGSSGSMRMDSIEREMASLLSDDSDLAAAPPPNVDGSNPFNAGVAGTQQFPVSQSASFRPPDILPPSPGHAMLPNNRQARQQPRYPARHPSNRLQQPTTPPRLNNQLDLPTSSNNDILDQLFPNSARSSSLTMNTAAVPTNASQFSSVTGPIHAVGPNSVPVNSNNSANGMSTTVFADSGKSTATPARDHNTGADEKPVRRLIQTPPPGMSKPDASVGSNDGDTVKTPPTTTTTKKEYQPKRLWTHLEDQPGRILANGIPATSANMVVDLRPRQELTAKWMLPLSYLRERMRHKQVNSIRDTLDQLGIGLYRRGCTENGTQASIVTKEILANNNETRKDYPFQVVDDTVVGTVPFHSPRTPGHVLFRLYWLDEPLYTLATGPALHIRVTEADFESSLRFILSNFKSKKLNPTSLSSLNSLSIVLDQFRLNSRRGGYRVPPHLEGAGRAIWGCICESRKVVETCASEYVKTSTKLEKLEETVEELRAKIAKEEEERAQDKESDALSEDAVQPEPSELVLTYREKMKALMGGRASCERRWRDSQLAFASILKAVVTNPCVSTMLRPDMVHKMRLEYQLWCPLCEEFATLTDVRGKLWYEPLLQFGNNITAERVRMCDEARSRMQVRTLGFDPNTQHLQSILYSNNSGGHRGQMNARAVNVFNHLSAAMGQLFRESHADTESVNREREIIRQRLEQFVQMCEGFPTGCRVVVFGSAANGFGSPKSDLDMCLQLPPGVSLGSENDPNGTEAMSRLATILEENGMKNVDTARLSARIAVIKFDSPRPSGAKDESGKDELIECDLSVKNPLAVLNTSLLRTYAEVNPVVRVLASVIKRWAKARDINNPARHTLSSYGYIIMLLHFLTYHKRAGNGLYVPIGGPEGKPTNNKNQAAPLLPNLQWMDDQWAHQGGRGAYRELPEMPRMIQKHPFDDQIVVNTYFYRPNGRTQMEGLQRLFPGQDLSLGILLASFFRYYAYEFDYKKHVVSLHSTAARGMVEREVKAELDGWRNYSAALTIEDPFETFYDVAHVLRGGYYHRIRREFAVAYSKIADVASGQDRPSWKNKSNLSLMTGLELVEWICEPITTDRDDG